MGRRHRRVAAADQTPLPGEQEQQIGGVGNAFQVEQMGGAREEGGTPTLDMAQAAGGIGDAIPDPSFNPQQLGRLGRGHTLRTRAGADNGESITKLKKGTLFQPMGATDTVDGVLWTRIKAQPSKGVLVEGWCKGTGVETTVQTVYTPITDPIMPADHTPSANDVRQHGSGDCYLMASLASVAQSQPGKIVEMFNPHPSDTSSSKVSVRFFEIVRQDYEWVGTKPSWVTVDKSIPTRQAIEGTDGDDELQGSQRFATVKDAVYWPAIVEKAFAGWGLRESYLNGSASGSYDKLDGGHGYATLTQITGEIHTETRLTGLNQDVERGSGAYSPDLVAMFDRIKDNLAGGGAMTLSTPQHWLGTDREDMKSGKGLTGEDLKAGLAAKHEYSIISTSERGGLKYIQIRNPWGEEGQKYVRAGLMSRGALKIYEVSGERGAVSDVELSDLPRHFDAVGAKGL